jgi:RNA polymerase sigma-70 factor, ECF subfamily
MLAYQKGDVSAYRTLVTRHHAPIYRFCFRSLRHKEAAADATQEVFLKVVKQAPTWTQKAKVTTWLYTLARNHCIDEARKAKFRRTDSLDDTTPDERVAGDARPGDAMIDDKRLRIAIAAGLQQLPDEQRQVFLLRQVSGMAFQDIGDIVGAGENTVKSRMRYALAALQKHLQEAGFGGKP